MSDYQPGQPHRGTCPNCDCRVGVTRPGRDGRRRCHRHKMNARDVAVYGYKICHGSGEVCREDRGERCRP